MKEILRSVQRPLGSCGRPCRLLNIRLFDHALPMTKLPTPLHSVPEPSDHDLQSLVALVGEDLIDVIVQKAPTKIQTRLAKAADHVLKANKLDGFDDEMGVIRYIAAEEELVVAIFQWLVLNAGHVGAHEDFLRKSKNHLVKLAFPIVLQQLAFVINGFLQDGLTLEGLEDYLTWKVAPTIQDGRVMLQVSDEANKALLTINPLDVSVNQMGNSPKEAVESLVQELAEHVRSNWNLSLKEFVSQRADFRNKLLYADDGMTYSMNESLRELRPTFERDLKHLLWGLGCILTNVPLVKSWGLVNQLLSLYRRVLVEAKLLKTIGDADG